MELRYEEMRHGRTGYRLATYSENTYGAEYRYHEDYEILYVHRGVIKIGIEDKVYNAPAGSIFFFDKNRPHYVDISQSGTPGEFHWYAILFHESILGDKDDVCRGFINSNLINTRLKPDEYLCTQIINLNNIDWSHNNGYEFRTKALLLNIIAHIAETGQYSLREGKRTFSNACLAVNSVVDIIESRYPENLTLENIADEIGYSAKHLSRIFKQYTNTSIIQYLIQHRIKAACHDLLYSKKTVMQVAMDCGFVNVSYFNRAFLKQLGMTPNQYRYATDKINDFVVQQKKTE